MPVLEINGQRVEVDDSLLSMSPEQQNATVDEIAQSLPSERPRIIEFEGRRIQVPGDTTDDEVRQILNSPPTVDTLGGAEQIGDGGDRDGVAVSDVVKAIASPGLALAKGAANYVGEFAKPERREQAARSLQVGLQGTGRGLADLAGAPGDIANLVGDTALSGADLVAELFGGDVDFRFGESPVGSNAIAEGSSDVIEALGGDIIPHEEMGPSERLAYNINRFGTEAAISGAGLARAGASRFAPGRAPKPRTGDALLKPYADNAEKTYRGDVAGGIGAGAGLTEAQEHDFGPLDPLVDAGAMLAGGIGGSVLADTPRIADGLRREVIDAIAPDENIPLGPTHNATSRRVSRRAAEMAQTMATDSAAAADTIAAQTREARAAGDPVATSGLLSDDIGLASAEQAVRTRNRVPFIERDRQLARASSDRVSGLADPAADQAAPARRVEAVRREALAPVEQQRTAGEDMLRRVEEARRAHGAPLQGAAGADIRSAASENVHAAIEGPYTEARAAKNQAFDALDPQRSAMVDATDIVDTVWRIRGSINELAPSGLQMPGEFTQALARLAPDEGGTETVALGDLVDLRKYLSTAHENARRSGNFTLADNLSALRKTINETIERTPEAAAANAQYRDFADRFRPSSADEGARFTREIDRGRDPAPSRTAGRFLSSPERAQALRRMAAGEEMDGVRQYMRSDFASRALSKDGAIDPNKAETWLRNNGDILNTYPELRREFDTLAQQAHRGEGLSQEARRRLDDATRAVVDRERTFGRSTVGRLMEDDPRNVANQLLSGTDYASADRMREITQSLSGDPEAMRGWKAAVAEVLSNKVRNVGGELARPETLDGPVSIAKMRRIFKQHESALAGVFSPEEMQSLRRAHDILAPLQKRGQQATVGSPTAENAMMAGAWDALGTALMFKFGAVHSGMIMHRLNRAMRLIPGAQNLTLDAKALDVVNRMWFDPDLAQHLLEAPGREINTPRWNRRLAYLLAVGELARDDEEDDLIGTIERAPSELTTAERADGDLMEAIAR